MAAKMGLKAEEKCRYKKGTCAKGCQHVFVYLTQLHFVLLGEPLLVAAVQDQWHVLPQGVPKLVVRPDLDSLTIPQSSLFGNSTTVFCTDNCFCAPPDS